MGKKIYIGELLTEKRIVYLRMRAQARYRMETWDLEWEDFLEVWPDDIWDRRGRTSDCLVLTRRDLKGPWHLDNIHIVTRAEQLSTMSSRPRKSRKLTGILYEEDTTN